MRKRFITPLFLILLVVCTCIIFGCNQTKTKLIVYSGKGLEKIIKEIKGDFESKFGVEVEVIYAGSATLLSTIKKTNVGDVFIPGSFNFIEKAGELIQSHKYVALHVPAFTVRKDNSKNINSIEDLLAPNVKIAIGNKDMCAIGRLSEEIIEDFPQKDALFNNISITGSTVNELLDLVVKGEVDTALVWRDMMLWPEASDLKSIEIPPEINKPKKIHIAVLATTTDNKTATLFTEFVANEGKTFFLKNGFGE